MSDEAPPASDLPQARVTPAKSSRWVWLIPLAAALFAAALLGNHFVRLGPVVTIHLPDGHGIKPTDTVRCLGIIVGEVEAVRLAEADMGVTARVRLRSDAAHLAVAGTQFWVVRPTANLHGFAGLETIAGPRYLGVLPGDGEPQATFQGLAEPPVVETVTAEGLEIMLATDQRGSLQPGAPVLYRGVRIGSVLSVGLASDAASVDARAYIRPGYVGLVRDNSRFWQFGGATVRLGVTGLSVRMRTLADMISGGVAMATPNQPGPLVATGHRFELAEQAEDAWLAWRPALTVGSDLLGPGVDLPPVVRVMVRRSAGVIRDSLGQSHAENCWALPTPDGLLLPPDMAPPNAGDIHLELAGAQLTVLPEAVSDHAGARLLQVAMPFPRRWRPEQARRLDAPEDLVILTDAPEAAISVAAMRVRQDDDVWRIDPSIVLTRDLHGAAVIARSDGLVVGILSVRGGRATVIPLTPAADQPTDDDEQP